MVAQIKKYTLWIGLIAALLLIMSLILDWENSTAPLSVLSVVALAVGIGSVEALKSYQYTAWILVAITCGMVYPSAFLHWGDFDLRNKWLLLIVVQMVMFGMGTQMSIRDFYGVKTMGKGVLVGILCHFTIMPGVGYLLTKIFHFEPEIAAGIILIGSCSSGLASNVMVFIARANLPLSVTVTAVSTLLAPIMTPLMMQQLAGTYVEVSFLNMCVEIIKIVIVPIGAALLYDAYLNGSMQLRKQVNILFVLALVGLIVSIGFWQLVIGLCSDTTILLLELTNFIFGAIIVGVVYYYLVQWRSKIHTFMPVVSMIGIVYFTTVTTAASRENILSIGILILIASILHNTLGYTFGYWISRALGFDTNSSRTIALEVGLQNGGMASGLAGAMGKLATVGLAAAIFSPWMNISGSLLANYWRRKDDAKQLK
jgi:bile acid:Na+ symporter, BASS family